MQRMLPPTIWIICRVCLKQQDVMFNIFEDLYFKNIWSSLRDCGGVPVKQVLENDGFPDKICERCLRNLWKAKIFREDCQRGHREFLLRLLDDNNEIRELELKIENDSCRKSLQPNVSGSATTKKSVTISMKTKRSTYSNSDLRQCQTSSDISREESSSKETIKQTTNAVDDDTSSTTTTTTTTTTTKESLSISIETKQSIYSNTDLTQSQTSSNISMKETNDETINPTIDATDETQDSVITQYCVVKKKNLNQQFEKPNKEPLVLLLKLKNRRNETIPKANELKETNAIKPQNRFSPESNLSNKLKAKRNKKFIKCKSNNLSCGKCNKGFKTFIALRHHMYTHSKPYQCKVCNKKFSQSHNLLSHNNRHTGIKPFYCRICYKTFADITNRNSHERLSHVQKEFKCMKCDKEFRFQSLLQKHSQSHRPKKCLICDKEFSTIHVVRDHHRRKHLKSLYI